MNPLEAVNTFNELIKGVLGMGGFKDFATLDKCREAVEVLLTVVQEKK